MIRRYLLAFLLWGLLLPPAIPVTAAVPDAAVLRWAIIDTPGSIANRNDIRSPSEVSALAVACDGSTIYVLDIPHATPPPVANPGLWKSTDGGISWSSKPFQHLAMTTPSPTFPVMDLAVAPDDPELLAVVCLNTAGTLRRQVYLSDDGGTTWVHSGAVPWVHGAGEQIGDIAISPGYHRGGRLRHDIIIGSRHPGDGSGEGEVYVLDYPGFGGWKAQGFTTGDIIAVAASPNYSSDFTLVVMSCTTQRTYISLGSRDIAASSSAWNRDSGWPVELCPPGQSGGSSSGEDRIISGDVALPADFSGKSHTSRLIFASYDSNGTALGTTQVLDDVYRLDNTRVTRLRLPGTGNGARVSSIAYYGDSRQGKLLAGEVVADGAQAEARVWICHDPLSPCPTWRAPLKPPSGGGNDGYANAQLAWLPRGTSILCGSGSGNRGTPQQWADPSSPAWSGQGLDESAVSLSQDDGKSWNQIGLIDTEISRLRCAAVADEGSTIYLASVNDHGLDGVWRSQGEIPGKVWQRVMCSSGESPILRLSPETAEGSAIFWADQGTERARSSTDRGQTWQDCRPGAMIQDMAAADAATLYLLQADGQVRRGSYSSSWIWAKNTDTGLAAAHTIAVQGDTVLVAAAAGEPSPLAYSADAAQTWTKIADRTPSAGNRHAAFDRYFETNQTVYVADDAGGIYRWQLGRSHSWDDLAAANHSFYGIVLGRGGAIYGAYCATESGVDRALYPGSGVPKPGVYWDSLTSGLTPHLQFTTEPTAISISGNSLWCLDARDYSPGDGEGCLWAFADTLAQAAPRLLQPDDGAALGCDPVSGRNQDIEFKWEQLSLAAAYQIEIAKDRAFSLRVTEAEPGSNPYYEPASATSPGYRVPPGALPEGNRTYYWRVRVRQAATGQVIRSQWSEKGSFSIKAGFRVTTPYPGAQALKPQHGTQNMPLSAIAFSWTPFQDATEYEFILAADSALTRVIVRETVSTTAYRYGGRLDYDTSYFWQVRATQPVPSEPSAVFSFTTRAESPAAAALPYHQVVRWLQASVVVNIFVLVAMVAVIALVVRRRF